MKITANVDVTGDVSISGNTSTQLIKAKTVEASVVKAGTIINTSDSRLKRQIRPLESNTGLTPKRFTMDGRERLGYIAQEVEQIAPEAVHMFDGFKSIELIAVLATVHADLLDRIKRLESELEELRK